MKVLIVDDDRLLARSLATILAAEPDIEVVGVGADGSEAVSGFAHAHPDVVLLDIQMPGDDGLDAAERILALDPDARVVFLTTFADDEYIARALRMGACGYLIKQDVAQIAPALRSVMTGMSVLEGRVLERTAAIGGAAGMARSGEVRPPAFAALTEREYEVVQAVSEGLDNAETAGRLHLSEGTVRNHISAILAKLGLRNRTQIAVLYYRGS
ncbi:response regulator transcription factor [Actinomyces sp.]|uniref:response regulator transcription factor n=1 Tax=Actinomyces sp. TaxID=29317 RepID=UPI0026DC26E5|nr:response regulator transcription factor [Actinomyces sp.]MDO4899207.1 response regulator transcription factor [Actinomyces sp.]